jgi:hypothetical protein
MEETAKSPELEGWSNQEIDAGLKMIPSLIASKSEEATNLNYEIQELKRVRKTQAAAAKLSYAETADKEPSATLLNAHADEKCSEMDKLILEKEKEHTLATIRIEELRDKWDGIRKAANLKIEEQRRQGDSITGGKPW